MERLIRLDEKTVKKYSPDDFALQKVLKKLGVKYEYRVDNVWVSGAPNKKPDEKRIVFSNIDKMRVGRDSYLAWQDLNLLKVDSPVKPETILQRIIDSRITGKSLVIFTPWGVRPEGKPLVEKTAMDRIFLLQEKLRTRKIFAETLIMPADLYATEINKQVSNATAKKYFSFVTKLAIGRGFRVKPWSKIRMENYEMYNKLSAQFNADEIRKLLKQGFIDRALEAAQRRSGYTTKLDIENSAYAYLRERLCEAEIIECIYRPIKISAVSKSKDTGVDRDLPRIYVLPENMQFPWLK